MKLTGIYARWVLESTPAGWDEFNFSKIFIDTCYKNNETDSEIKDVFDLKEYVCTNDESIWNNTKKEYSERTDIHVWRDEYDGNILKDVIRSHINDDVFIFIGTTEPTILENQLKALSEHSGRLFILIDNTTEWLTKREVWKSWGAQQVIDIFKNDRIIGAGFIPTKKGMNDRMFILYDKKNV